MKRGTIQHPKMADLACILGEMRVTAVGVMESLWHLAAAGYRNGDLSGLDTQKLADMIGWTKDAKTLVSALIEARWLDACQTCRGIFIHDWPDHCEESVRKTLSNNRLGFSEHYKKCRKTAGDIRSFLESSGKGEKIPESSACLSHALPLPCAAPVPEPVPAPASPTDKEEEPHADANSASGAGVLDTKPKRKGRKPKATAEPPADPAPFKQFTDAFCDEWKRAHKAKYDFQPKDGVAASKIWAYANEDLSAAMAIVLNYFLEPGDFYRGHPLTKLAADLPRFTAADPDGLAALMAGRNPTPEEEAEMQTPEYIAEWMRSRHEEALRDDVVWERNRKAKNG